MSKDQRGLPPRQAELLDVITTLTKKNGWAPSVRELRDVTGAGSTSTVSYRLKQLEAAGLIRRGGGPRTLTVVTNPGTEDK